MGISSALEEPPGLLRCLAVGRYYKTVSARVKLGIYSIMRCLWNSS